MLKTKICILLKKFQDSYLVVHNGYDHKSVKIVGNYLLTEYLLNMGKRLIIQLFMVITTSLEIEIPVINMI